MRTQEARNNIFQNNFLLAGNSEIFFSQSANYYFFPAFFLFLGTMHTQEARNNVFQINFLLSGNSEKKILLSANSYFFPAKKLVQIFTISRAHAHPGSQKQYFQNNFFFSQQEKYYFFQLKNQFKFLLFLGPIHTQEARNNDFPTDFRKKNRSRKSVIFSSSKIISNFSYFQGLCAPRKPEIMFFKIIFCLREIRKKDFSQQKKFFSSSKISSFSSIFMAYAHPGRQK